MSKKSFCATEIIPLNEEKYIKQNLVKDFQICGSESDPFLGKISTDSPLAKAVLSHRVGEKFIMTTENGIDVELELLSLK